jgi:hypothetical protein
MIGVDTLQALLETAGLRADLAEGKIEALRMKVSISLEVIGNLRDQIRLLEAELADVRELVPVDDVDEPCALHNCEGCCSAECLATENVLAPQTWVDCDMSVEEEYARANAFTRVLTTQEMQFLASLDATGDFLDEFIDDRTAANPEFPAMVAARRKE